MTNWLDDGGGGGASMSISLTATLGRLADSLDASRKATERAVQQAAELMPVFGKTTNVLAYPSSGVGVIALGGPTQGRVRLIRKIVVGGVTPTTTAAGRCDVFVSQLPSGLVTQGGLGSMSLGEWEDGTANLPAIGPWSNEQIVLKPYDHLLLVISNGTSGQQYQASARWDEYMESPSARAAFDL